MLACDSEMLLEALTHDPGDDNAWLALADSLEEQVDPRDEITRLSLWLRRRPEDPEHPAWERQLRELVAQDVRVCLPRRSIQLAPDATLPMVLIPPGTFWMGSLDSEEGHQDDELRHRVTLTQGFWMSVHQVTQAQWQAVLESNPSHFHGPSRPVERISWLDCQAFCQRLSDLVGRCCRLPTEAEWEYACRAGTTTKYHTGDDDAALDLAGWYRGNSGNTTHTVCHKASNAWGLFDMHGNVWEWCTDWYGPYQQQREEVVSLADDRFRVLRGGSWFDSPYWCRSAFRYRYAPYRCHGFLGCRVVL